MCCVMSVSRMMVECWRKDLVAGVAQVCSAVWLRQVWRAWCVFLFGGGDSPLLRRGYEAARAACVAVVSVLARGGHLVGVRPTGGRASIIGGSFGAHGLTSTEVEGTTGVVGGGVVVL